MDSEHSDVKKKRKSSKQTTRCPPSKQGDEPDKSVPKGREEKTRQQYKDTVTPRQKLLDRIKQMQKDRAKGSYACEENANHEY